MVSKERAESDKKTVKLLVDFKEDIKDIRKKGFKKQADKMTKTTNTAIKFFSKSKKYWK